MAELAAEGDADTAGGYAGDGKSTLTLALAAAFSIGGTLPDGSRAPILKTLLVATEDDDDKVIKPRLEVHGADHDHIRTLKHVHVPGGGQRMINLRTDVPLLRQEVLDHGIDLVVIDPLSSVMANGDRNSEGDVRDTMQPLVRMMEETGVAVIGVMHIGKTDGQARTMQKLMGSTAYSALARAILMVGELPEKFQFPDQPTRKALGVVKSNYAVIPKTISFCRPLDAALEYLGDSPVKIDDVFGYKDKPAKKGSPTETDKAEEWLEGELANGPRNATELEERAKEEGIARTTLHRARKQMGVKSVRRDGVSVWYPPAPIEDVA